MRAMHLRSRTFLLFCCSTSSTIACALALTLIRIPLPGDIHTFGQVFCYDCTFRVVLRRRCSHWINSQRQMKEEKKTENEQTTKLTHTRPQFQFSSSLQTFFSFFLLSFAWRSFMQVLFFLSFQFCFLFFDSLLTSRAPNTCYRFHFLFTFASRVSVSFCPALLLLLSLVRLHIDIVDVILFTGIQWRNARNLSATETSSKLFSLESNDFHSIENRRPKIIENVKRKQQKSNDKKMKKRWNAESERKIRLKCFTCVHIGRIEFFDSFLLLFILIRFDPVSSWEFFSISIFISFSFDFVHSTICRSIDMHFDISVRNTRSQKCRNNIGNKMQLITSITFYSSLLVRWLPKTIQYLMWMASLALSRIPLCHRNR